MCRHFRCGQWRNFSRGELLDVQKFWIWRIFYAVFAVLSEKYSSVAIYVTLLRNLFCRNIRTFYVEKNRAKNLVRGEKMTNIMFANRLPISTEDIQNVDV